MRPRICPTRHRVKVTLSVMLSVMVLRRAGGTQRSRNFVPVVVPVGPRPRRDPAAAKAQREARLRLGRYGRPEEVGESDALI